MEILQILGQLALGVGQLLLALLALAVQWWLVIAWFAWWTFGVNWQTARQVLKQGAWAPLLLLMFIVALVWSRLTPAPLTWGIITLPNFWWQLGAVTLLVGLTSLCGVVQDALGWRPPEINLDPPAESSGEHGHPGHH